MSAAKVKPDDYIQFLIASPAQYSCVEAARVTPTEHDPPAHDAYNRLLTRLEPQPETLWQEARSQVAFDDGVLILDDSTLDKPYARKMGLVGWHWSGKHHAVVKGINLLTLLWTDGDRHVPCDYSVYDKPQDGLSKNDLFRLMLRRAKQRGLQPRCVCFDTWYSALDNLKEVRSCRWTWLTRLKSNRKVRVSFGRPQAVSTIEVPHGGVVVHLPGYGSIKVFRVVAKDGDTEHWATNDLSMDELTRLKYADFSWRIEEYHRGLKQHCGAEDCQVRRAKGQRNHIGLSIRAFLRIEIHCFALGISWFQAALDVIRPAVRAYLANPTILLPKCA
jgi:putative transposase